MKRYSIQLVALAILVFSSNLFAQQGHFLEIDDGLFHYSTIRGSFSGGTYTLPNGGGTFLTQIGNVSNAWLLGGNSSSSPNNQIGTLDGSNFNIVTGGVGNIRMAFDPSGNIGIGIPNPTHLLEVKGTIDASDLDVIASPKWDLAVYGDIAASGIIKSGAGVTINGVSIPHEVGADQPLNIYTNNGDLTLSTGAPSGMSINMNPEGIVNVTAGPSSPSVNGVGAMEITGVSAPTPNYGDVRISHPKSGGLGGTLAIRNSAPAAFGNAAAIGFDVDNTTLWNNAGINNTNAEIRAVNMSGANNATDLAFSVWNGAAEQEVMRVSNTATLGIGSPFPASSPFNGTRLRLISPATTVTWDYGVDQSAVNGQMSHGYIESFWDQFHVYLDIDASAPKTTEEFAVYQGGSHVGVGLTTPVRVFKVDGTGAVTANSLSGAGANKYAEQHAVAGGEIAGNTVTIANSIVAGGTSIVVATLVSGPGGFVTSASAAAGQVVITFNAAPTAATVVNYIVVNP